MVDDNEQPTKAGQFYRYNRNEIEFIDIRAGCGRIKRAALWRFKALPARLLFFIVPLIMTLHNRNDVAECKGSGTFMISATLFVFSIFRKTLFLCFVEEHGSENRYADPKELHCTASKQKKRLFINFICLHRFMVIFVSLSSGSSLRKVRSSSLIGERASGATVYRLHLSTCSWDFSSLFLSIDQYFLSLCK